MNQQNPLGTRAVYQVLEHPAQASDSHSDQMAIVGRSPDGVHLLLTEEAAAQLAHFLIGTTITDPGRLTQHIANGIDDPRLWSHVAVDLVVARVMNNDAGGGEANVAYVRSLRATPGGGVK